MKKIWENRRHQFREKGLLNYRHSFKVNGAENKKLVLYTHLIIEKAIVIENILVKKCYMNFIWKRLKMAEEEKRNVSWITSVNIYFWSSEHFKVLTYSTFAFLCWYSP